MSADPSKNPDISLERPRDPQHFYEVGTTAYFASSFDQRFGFSAYVPQRPDAASPSPVAVLVHDTMRWTESYRTAFSAWSERTGVALLLPLFPAGIRVAGDLHGYKYLDAQGVRYDTVFLKILEEASEQFHLDVGRFFLFGFSGGAQFVHRWAMLYPERVRGVSIAAPGGITIPDDDRPWWVGTSDTRERFGRAVSLPALRGLETQVIVGEADVETWEVSGARMPSGPYWAPGADDFGATRVERALALADALERCGAEVSRVSVPGVGHDPGPLFSSAMRFFDEVIAREKDGHATTGQKAER